MRIKLQNLRQSQGYTQTSFAEVIGISRNHYSQIESGDKSPSMKVALKIKQTLGYQGDDIFEDRAYGHR